MSLPISSKSKALVKFLVDSARFGTVKRMFADGGGDFIGKESKKVLLGQFQTSAPHSPHQNGTIEQWWWTVFEMGHCLLIESRVPRKFWPYVIRTATYICNRSYQKRTGQTLYKLLTVKVPDVSNMYVFQIHLLRL
jgi:uncharacterized secreted protein with C-terminal beta-propeller domain